MPKRLSLCASLVAVGIAGSAFAGPLSDVPGASFFAPGTFYLGAGLVTTQGDLDDFKFGNLTTASGGHAANLDQSLFDLDTGGNRWGPVGHLGYVFSGASLPGWMGQSLRATLSGDYQSGDSSDSATGPADANEGFVSTNGQFVESLSPSRIVSAQLHSTFDTWSMGLTVQSDFPIRGGVLIVTPNLSLFGGQTTLNHEYAQVIIRDVPARRRQPAATILTGTYNLSEDLENDFYGGSVGADLSFKATPDLIFFVGGKIGASYDDARLRSRDSCATLNGLTQCGDAPPDSGFATSASDARTRLGFVAGARVGLVYNFKYFIVALVGWGEYDSDVPSVRNATRSDPSPTSITFDDQWEWGGRITVTVPLNHLFRRGA